MAMTPPLVKNPKCLKDLDVSVWGGHLFFLRLPALRLLFNKKEDLGAFCYDISL